MHWINRWIVWHKGPSWIELDEEVVWAKQEWVTRQQWEGYRVGHHLFQDLSMSLEVHKSKLGQTDPDKRRPTSKLKFKGSSNSQMDKQAPGDTRSGWHTRPGIFQGIWTFGGQANIGNVCFTRENDNCVNHRVPKYVPEWVWVTLALKVRWIQRQEAS